MNGRLIPITAGVVAACFAFATAVPARDAEREASAAASELQTLAEHGGALAASDMMIRMQAVKALGAFLLDRDARNPGEVRALLHAAAKDPDENVAYQAEVLLAQLDGIDIIPAEVRETHRKRMAREALAEHASALGATDMIDRLQAVKALAALAESGDASSPSEILALLTAATADLDPDVASQAQVALARLDGIDPIPAEVRQVHRLTMERDEVDEWETALGSDDMMDRLRAVKFLAARVADAVEPDRMLSLLQAAQADPDLSVATQAQLALEDWRARQPALP